MPTLTESESDSKDDNNEIDRINLFFYLEKTNLTSILKEQKNSTLFSDASLFFLLYDKFLEIDEFDNLKFLFPVEVICLSKSPS